MTSGTSAGVEAIAAGDSNRFSGKDIAEIFGVITLMKDIVTIIANASSKGRALLNKKTRKTRVRLEFLNGKYSNLKGSNFIFYSLPIKRFYSGVYSTKYFFPFC